MHRNKILELLEKHTAFDSNESKMTRDAILFVKANPTCFERTLLEGHITASAWVIDAEKQVCLLTHHRKLNQWFQLGGHCDGDADVLASAKREVEEESGLSKFQVKSQSIFDVDVHSIPANGKEPAHLHYDIRFLFEADSSQPLIVSAESKSLAWIPFNEVEKYNHSTSVLRMVSKMSI